MGRVGGRQVMMNVRPVMLERLRGRNEGWEGGGVSRMGVYGDNRVVRILVMRERMRGGMMVRLRRGIVMVMVSMRDGRDKCGGVLDNRGWRLIS